MLARSSFGTLTRKGFTLSC